MTNITDIIDAAIRNERVMQFWFKSQSRPQPMWRTVSPYELSDDGEALVAFDHDRQAIRRFGLDGFVDNDIELPDNEEYVQPVEQS
jgi:predicted DNA-binding transcriptional regulator YafY